MTLTKLTNSKTIKSLAQSLGLWYLENRRPLPWRKTENPYLIWISEVMLQQTTVAAVIPYFERFIKKFPCVESLAKAPLDEVYEAWAGLGYYSRARNLHKSAQRIAKEGFPQTASELLTLQGFGPYTSRAVASLAFGEPVGVLDGNVIRVLCRVFGLSLEWWKSKEKAILQNLSDQLASQSFNQNEWKILFLSFNKKTEKSQPAESSESSEFPPLLIHKSSSLINQGLMELGASLCSPQKPQCILCPWRTQCLSYKKRNVETLPLKKPKRKKEIWIWETYILKEQEQIALIQNDYAPFLKKQWIFPGKIHLSKNKPKQFDIKHSITHHEIYIQRKLFKKTQTFEQMSPFSLSNKNHLRWFLIKDLNKINPSSLLKKVLNPNNKLEGQ